MPDNRFDLTRKVAVVTGGSGVLGGAMCRGLAQAGTTVVILARTEAKVQALADEIQQAGGKALAVCGNVLDWRPMAAWTSSSTARAETDLGQFGEPDDLIGTMLWLVSDASWFMTGIVVPVDGGFSAFSGV
jgi:NAD(P)-dependent dehydrogenase (short-subunit alcohol dehydrogenase family)